jgi:hypothetical protein
MAACGRGSRGSGTILLHLLVGELDVVAGFERAVAVHLDDAEVVYVPTNLSVQVNGHRRVTVHRPA